ncbi:SCY1-like protein 2 [Sparganum proliferum]
MKVLPSYLLFSFSFLSSNQLSYFHDPGVSALQSLDELRQLDNLARSRFYKNLPASIRILPKRINLHRVYSQLSEEFANPNMVPFVLPPILEIVDMISREEFTTVILPTFQKVFCIKEPDQVLLALLQNLNILTSKFSPTDFKRYMLPVLSSSLETNTTSIVQLCLKSLPDVAQLMDFTVLKSSIVPRLKKAYLRHDLVSLRLETLICLGKVLEYLDKWCVMEDVFLFLVEVKSREPILVVAVLTIYKVAFLHKKLGISRDVLATRVIPHLLQLSMDNNLNLTQYAAFAELIRQMITQLETQQKAKLSELHGQAEESVCIPSFILSPTMTGTSSEMVDLMMSSIGGLSSLPTAPSADPTSRSEVNLFGPTTSENGVVSSGGGGSQQPACKNPRQLTLEDKKRIIAGAEQSERLRVQPRLSPQRQDTTANTTRQYQQTAPVDLTGKLLTSNLEELSLTRRTTPASVMSGPTQFGFGSPQPQLGFPMMSPPIAATPTPLSSGMGGPMAFAAPLTPTSIMVQGPKAANSATTPLSMSDIDDLLS